MNNQPPNPQPDQQNQNKNPPQDQNKNPPQDQNELLQPPLIQKPPPSTQDNIMNEIEREKNELEAIIGRLKFCKKTNPMRAQLASSLEPIMSHAAFFSS